MVAVCVVSMPVCVILNDAPCIHVPPYLRLQQAIYWGYTTSNFCIIFELFISPHLTHALFNSCALSSLFPQLCATVFPLFSTSFNTFPHFVSLSSHSHLLTYLFVVYSLNNYLTHSTALFSIVIPISDLIPHTALS